jgi:hypothetical protein
MSIFGKLVKTAFDTVTLPIDVAKDVVTMGGAMTEKDKPYTVEKLKKLLDDGKELRDEIDDL